MSSEEDFDRLMDATQTLLQLKVGDVLTQQMIDDLHLVDKDHREESERAIDAFAKGYEAGLERGAGADTAKLIEERDSARNAAAVANALSSYRAHTAFIQGARVCREMMARFVEQGGDSVTAGSIRANWHPAWGNDPGAPTEEAYKSAGPCKISCKEDQSA